MRRRTALRTLGGASLSVSLAGCAFDLGPQLANDYEPLDSVSLEGAAEAVVGDSGETVYVAGFDGFAVVDASDPTDLTVLTERRSLLDHPDVESIRDERFIDILDLKVSDERIVVPGPANEGYDTFQGFLVYDVSDPADPALEFEPYETEYHIHNCFLDGDDLYVVANNVTEADVDADSDDAPRNPLVVFDLSGEEIEEIGRWSLLEYEPEWADVDWLLRYLHDVYVRDDLAVLAYWNAGTYLLDVSDPADPEFRSRIVETDLETQRGYDTQSAVRDAQLGLPGNDHYSAVDDTGEILAIGRESWETDLERADGPGGIDLYDLSDPAEPEYRTTLEAPTGYDDTYHGEPWTTAHNFELQDGRLCSSWYEGGVKIHELSDLDSPEEIASWRAPKTASFWTARVLTAEETFVASSTEYTNTDGPENAVYAFPIEAGEQADPPSLTDPSVFDSGR